MKRTSITILFIFLFAGALGLTLFTEAKKINADVAAGNLAFAAQDYETALQHYSAAHPQAPGQAEPLYNAANVYYRQQMLDKAQQSLEQALAQPHKTIEEFIRFNLGNVAYLAKQFDAAVTQYESVLRIDPADQSAKYNLELALLQQQDQQNQQQKDQQNQQASQQQDQQDQQQNQPGQQDQQQNQQGQQGQQDQQENQQGQQGQQDQQQNGQGQQGQPQDQQSQQGQQDQLQNGQGQQGQPQDQQGQPDKQQNQQGQSGQPQNQQSGQQDQSGQPHDQQPGQPDGQVAGMGSQQGLTMEQARQLLAAIAGNSKTLLQQLQMYYYIPGVTPEKDW
jgi:Ca-activated chloride channel homolog